MEDLNKEYVHSLEECDSYLRVGMVVLMNARTAFEH